jgi:hypothetical protein
LQFRAGQCFIFPLTEEGSIPHVWVICTSPNEDGQFATASFTSLKGAKDQTVILNSGDHPSINRPTCIAYGFAKVLNCDNLQGLINTEQARLHRSDLREDLLKLVVDGFSASDFTSKRVADFVKACKGGSASGRR